MNFFLILGGPDLNTSAERGTSFLPLILCFKFNVRSFNFTSQFKFCVDIKVRNVKVGT